MKITFCGAAQSVTGSKHLIETGDFKILLDCGLHQGGHTPADKVNQILPFDAKTIDWVILSHAHADHSGMLPILVKNGFKGKIYCTSATADIAKFILLDSAAVQEQDLRYAQKHGIATNAEVMYSEREAKNTFPLFEVVSYFRLSQKWTEINDRIRFKLYDAGHILGSAITYLEIRENDMTKTLAFTGDIGQPGMPILHDPEPILEPTETLISEATYGDTKHRPLSDAVIQLKEAVEFAVVNKSKIIVPAFALGRTQELIYILHNMFDRQLIAPIPIYIDGAMTLNITDVFMQHSEDFNQQAWQDFGSKNENPLLFKNLKYIHSTEESQSLNTMSGPFMVISSSGMMEGGRILHHLTNSIENPDNTILITGYQAEGTTGRRIQNGEKTIQILGLTLNVKARIITMNELSAHGDQTFLNGYINAIPGLKNLFLVHTELPQAEAFKKVLEAGNPAFEITIPGLMQSFDL